MMDFLEVSPEQLISALNLKAALIRPHLGQAL